MALSVILSLAAVSIALGAFAVILHRTAFGRILVYGGSLAVGGVALVLALTSLLSGAPVETVGPTGRPAVDRRAFPAGRAIGLFSCRGQSRRRGGEPLRARLWPAREGARSACCPSIRCFSPRMNLVVLADDAFTFLFTWEFMSLSSWALVMAHDQVKRERARRLRLSGDGELRHARAAARLRPARRA